MKVVDGFLLFIDENHKTFVHLQLETETNIK